MPTYKRKPDFFDTEEGVAALQKLKAMSLSEVYNTPSSYSANTRLYPDNLIPFVDKHMFYLRDHPNLDVTQYVSNLKLMTRIN